MSALRVGVKVTRNMEPNQQVQDVQALPQRQVSGNNVFISFFGDISLPNVQNLMNTFLQISGQNPSLISFLFSSPGGDVSAGITFYNFLKSLSTKIIVYNMGNIDSVATVIFLAGNERFACPHSTFLFHGTKCRIFADQALDLSNVREMESRIEKDEEKIAGIIASNTNITEDEIKELFRQGASKDLSFAKDKNIIKDIKVPEIGDSLCVNVSAYVRG